LHGASRATRPQVECPQRHRATNHRLMQWRVTELYDAQWRGVGEDAAKIVYSGGYDKTGSSERQNAPTPHMSAPGGLARRFWGDASVYHMSVTSMREHSPTNIMARHQTLRRAMASASAKMPRSCISVSCQSRGHSLILYVAGSALTIQPDG